VEAAGWVVPPERNALATALAEARDGAAPLAAVARSRYERVFHPDVVTRRLIEVYAGVAARP
jgi:glycosyltransferase involved in cell wall biosynthesis